MAEFARAVGLSNGITGYALHVTIVAIYAWSRHWGDFRTALISVLDCGGDTDTSGAIVGALAGATKGLSGIPEEWTRWLAEWPRSPKVMAKIGLRLAEQQKSEIALGCVRYFWPAIPLRNLFFLIVVLFHGLRRLAPPY